MDLQQRLQQLPEEYCRFYRSPSEYLHLLDTEQVIRAERFVAMTDHIGTPRISIADWNAHQNKIPRRLREFSEQNCSRSGEYLALRGDTYYAGYKLLNVKDRKELAKTKDRILKMILTSYEDNEDLVEEVRSSSEVTDPIQEPHIHALLELQKQISLTLLKCYYRSMLKEESGDKESFDRLLELCAGNIGRSYKFMVGGNIPDGKELPKFLKKGWFPQVSAEDFWRELDDPVKIAFYCLNAAQDIEQPYELIINPFSGGTEIGFAFKAIGETIGKELVDDILLLNYSRYRQGHTLEGTRDESKIRLLLEVGFPSKIREDAYLRLCGQESCIVDDNTTTGSTLRELRDALVYNKICEKVDIGAVELGRIDRLGRFDESIIHELVFEPIGDRLSEAKKREIILKSLFP